LTARALAQKAREEGDALDASDESDEDWRSARSAQTTRSWVTATGRDASETDDAFSCETENDTGEPDLRYFSRAADEAFSSFSSRRDADPSRGAPSLARAQPGAIVSPALVSNSQRDARTAARKTKTRPTRRSRRSSAQPRISRTTRWRRTTRTRHERNATDRKKKKAGHGVSHSVGLVWRRSAKAPGWSPPCV
jgi:hypothetical protein